MSKMSSTNALGMSPAEVPCPGGNENEASPDGKLPKKDDPRDPSPKKAPKPKKEKAPAT